MASLENMEGRDSVDKVLAEFEQKAETLKALCERITKLITDCLEDAEVRFQSVQSRVKKKEKLREKYLDPTKNYSKLDDITDQAALRVITYYEDELDRVAEVIKKEFTVILQQSEDKRDTEPDKFGYYAINLICMLNESRKTDVQFKKFANTRFEIQVTSILRHAWSEIEHGWYDLKEKYPDAIKRRFYRVAALLEIAESEFLALRDQKRRYERSVDVRVEANVPDMLVDPVSLKTFIYGEPVVISLDATLASYVGMPLTDPSDQWIETFSKLIRFAGLTSLQDLRRSLTKYKSTLPKYVKMCLEHLGPPPTGTRLIRGLSIYHLAMMLIAASGEEQINEARQISGVITSRSVDPKLQVLFAQKAVAEVTKLKTTKDSTTSK